MLGGMQKHAAYIIRHLAGTEHKVDVLIPNHGVSNAEEAESRFWGNVRPDNIRFHVIPYPKTPRFPGHYVVASYLYSRRITNYFSHKISTTDILFGKGYTLWHWLARQKRPQIPVIVQLHGLEMFQPAFAIKEMLHKMLMRIPAVPIIRLTDYIFSYGGEVKEILRKQGKSDDCIFEQYGAVDDFWLYPEPFPKENGMIRKFLFVARNEYRKGYHLLHETLQELVTDNETFEIDIVGELPKQLELQDPRIRYHGNLSAEALKSLKDRCEVLLLPSLSEGFPTIIIESMARGICIAASEVGAVTKVIDKDTGWLLQPGSSKSLKDTMKAIIRTPEPDLHRKQMACYQKVLHNFRWESTVNQLVSHLQSAAHDYRERITRQQS